MKRNRRRLNNPSLPQSIQPTTLRLEEHAREGMTAQEVLIADLQKRLHEQNQQRLAAIEKRQEAMEETQKEHGLTLAQILANTEVIGELKKRVDDHDTDINRTKGGSAVIALLVGAGEFIWHWFHRG